MAAPGESHRPHPRGARADDPMGRILHHRAGIGRDAQPFCGQQEQVGGGLAPRDLIGAERVGAEPIRQPRHLQGGAKPVDRTARGNRHRDAARRQVVQQGGNAGDHAQFRGIARQQPVFEIAGEVGQVVTVQRLGDMADDGLDRHAQEFPPQLVHGGFQPLGRHQVGKGCQRHRFAVHQAAVHVEDHGADIGHADPLLALTARSLHPSRADDKRHRLR